MNSDQEEGFPRLMQAFSSDDPDNIYPIEKWAHNSLDVMLFKRAHEGMDVREGGLTREAIFDRMIYCLFRAYPKGLQLSELQKEVKVKLDKETEIWVQSALHKSTKTDTKITVDRKTDVLYSLNEDSFVRMKKKYERDMQMLERFVESEADHRPFTIRLNPEIFTKDGVVYGLIILILVVFVLRYFLLSYS